MMHTVIPNFVDTSCFRPASEAERKVARDRFDLPPDALIVGDVAAVKRDHKRLDVLIREFRNLPGGTILMIAGARTPDSDAVVSLADRICPGRVRFRFDLSRELMPVWYQTLDVFCHAALLEMMPIALLEAMATGIPVVHHDHPVMNWMVADGGLAVDMRTEAAAGTALTELLADNAVRQRMAAAARHRVESVFSKTVVIPQIIEYYRAVLTSK